MIIEKYNTALKQKAVEQTRIVDFDNVVDIKDVRILRHDISKGYNENFKVADCVYSEPSWIQDYEPFTKETVAEGTNYNDYINGIINTCIVLNNINTCIVLNKPVFLIIGKQMKKFFSKDIFQFSVIRFKFHGNGEFILATFQGQKIPDCKNKIPDCKNELELRDFVCSKYKNRLIFVVGMETF